MRLLIVGSLNGQIGAASQVAITRGVKVLHADSIERGLEDLRSGKGADLVMIDANLNVANLVNALLSERISVPVVACGTGTDADIAVRAIKAGAKEHIPLPPDAEMIAAILAAVADENNSFVHADPRTKDVLKLAAQIAPSDASVMITGASGTGKELMAKYVHAKSRRADHRFVAVNCAAIPENLLESELFGHEKGAFTGAVARRIGKFEEASGGTLLLDEISEMEPRMQAKLLRAVQEREIDRVGGKKPVAVDVRIIATSNRDLEKEVAEANFREDLYFRLNVVNLLIPTLRDRPEDILVLADFFVKKFAEANDTKVRPVSDKAKTALLAYEWPGNVRELENAVHRAVLLSEGTEIEPAAFGLTVRTEATDTASRSGAAAGARAGASSLVGRTVSDVERDLIIDTLQHCLGNRTHAANILGISIRTLRNKLKLYMEDGFAVPQPGNAEQPVI
ncbi:MAG: sigma-54-dependent Fis family transcriptional regulator [Rhodospirillales bacterium]|jgi:two-component system, response regulator FlrC|nr:sigma-54-dependent Fis family transcriptional regulator [Rhodospirillales bacterium]